MLPSSEGNGCNKESRPGKILIYQLDSGMISNGFDVSLATIDELNSEAYGDDIHDEKAECEIELQKNERNA